ncbi:MAG: transcription-repair coupling factor [Bdellovibrionaceae bacterium]|nr:transcription-repair coupling factor [Pseudobdellovibrionaceae bacterium]
MPFSTLQPHFERILEREWSRGKTQLQISGTTSATLMGMLLSQADSPDFQAAPHLVIVPSDSEATQLAQGIKFFSPAREAYILGSFDVSPYSGLYPKRETLANRSRFLFKAQHAKPGEIFIATLEGLLQKTVPAQIFKRHCFRFRKGDSIPEGFTQILHKLGYLPSPMVEDIGNFSARGGIMDLYSPAHELPVRMELFGDEIESLRFFDPEGQRSSQDINAFDLIPAREIMWDDSRMDALVQGFRESVQGREIDQIEYEENLRALSREADFNGIDFLVPLFHGKLESPLEHFAGGMNVWLLDQLEIARRADLLWEDIKNDYATSEKNLIRLAPELYWSKWDELEWLEAHRMSMNGIQTQDLTSTGPKADQAHIEYPTMGIGELAQPLSAQKAGSQARSDILQRKFTQWRADGYVIFVSVRNQAQAERLRVMLNTDVWKSEIVAENAADWGAWHEQQQNDPKLLHFIPRLAPESQRIPDDKVIVIRDEDLLGKKTRMRSTSAQQDFTDAAKRLNFGDLKPGDAIVHIQHGIGIYDGLKVMSIGGADSEFIQISYKDKDKLYLPVYRVGQLQKFSGHAANVALDRLGTGTFEKTKGKVKNALRDLALDLLKLYAERNQTQRPPFPLNNQDFQAFETAFPYEETNDQLRAIGDIVDDFEGTKPMDRLICGDVGFGKTEVAMRAAFIAANAGLQVAVLAPTTVLTFQHFETFKKRFKDWPLQIRALNRFVPTSEAKKTLTDLKEGRVDILIGTHRLLSKDVEFKRLGLLVVDEEQKFGVAHKEKIRKMKLNVDTIAMSATPIPRTLNMSLAGIRDLSLINTAPVDRLPTRTFITKWDRETIRKAIYSEVQRGGQVYFIHNRVQSIYQVVDELRELIPDLRIKVGHGQMEEHELEKTMVAFFNHEIDVLVCTTIVESGMDVPRANTMFIDQAHTLGLSQLYQLRGRVGRSKQRAYCYLLLPKSRVLDKTAQERLKVIQENSALGSGIRIAQYDLELRGAGNILGEEQSGHIDSVGYELYMDLLNEAVSEARGEKIDRDNIDPEINLRIPAMIPESYIGDIRIRLSYYKALSEIKNADELDAIEAELKDQFGALPEPTVNLMGLMLIRAKCRELGIRDLSAGPKNLSLLFSERTLVKPEVVIKLAMKENKKYAVTPDNRLNIRMNEITWPRAYEELVQLEKLAT